MKDKLFHVPKKPGVYIFKDRRDRVLYVGKAKNLKNRLRTYFQKPDGLDMRKASMSKLIKDFSYIITGNELEALILEASLIKQYKPRFNVILRDDKSYPYLKLTVREEWPKLEVTRRIVKDGSLFFGPYVPSRSMWEALSFIKKNFPVRPCRYALDKIARPCIQYQMGRCNAPCAGLISRDEYMKIVDEVRLFLKGEKGELLGKLQKNMAMLSDELKFEEAARIRDRIKNLKNVWESQRVISPELGDIDVMGFHSDSVDAVFNVFFIRNGILTGTKDFYLKDAGGLSGGEVIHSFIEMFYVREIIPPEEIIVRKKPDDMQNLKAWLKTKKGRTVDIKTPQKGKRLEILNMADENAAQILYSKKTPGADETLRAIKDRLKLPFLPLAIGAFDVSTTSGNESVGAFICWSEGKFEKDLYRRLRIRSVPGIDDYSMMNEIITRTLKNLEDRVPDLIIIDGGMGHLEIARNVIETNKITCSEGSQPMLVAIAKNPDRALTLNSDCIDLEDRSQSSLLLKKIRDEVHRFAVSYHRKLRDKKLMESPLEKIHGIGEKRRFELLRHFGSMENIRNATIEEIARIKGFNKYIAEKVIDSLRGK